MKCWSVGILGAFAMLIMFALDISVTANNNQCDKYLCCNFFNIISLINVGICVYALPICIWDMFSRCHFTIYVRSMLALWFLSVTTTLLIILAIKTTCTNTTIYPILAVVLGIDAFVIIWTLILNNIHAHRNITVNELDISS